MYRRTQDDPVLEEVDAMVNVNLTKPIILAVKILFIIGYIGAIQRAFCSAIY